MIGHPKHVSKALEVGVDLICPQAGEGGGHIGDMPASILIPAVVDEVRKEVSSHRWTRLGRRCRRRVRRSRSHSKFGLGRSSRVGPGTFAPIPRHIRPDYEKGEVVEKSTNEGTTFSGTIEDRRRVYGSNVLPVCKSKYLLQLMWLALKDKVLVSPSHFYLY